MNNITMKSLTQGSYPALHQAGKKVADYIFSHVHETANYSVTKLSEKSCASEATIVRTCKKLDYRSYYHLKIALAKEAISPDNGYPDNTDFIGITSLATLLLKKQAEDLIQSTQSSNAEMLESILKLFANCDTTFSFAVGNSNPLTVYGAYKFSQLGLKTAVYVGPEMQINAAYSIGKRGLAIDVFSSGSTNSMVDISKVVKERGAEPAYIISYTKSSLSELSTYQLNAAVSDKTSFEASDSTRAPATGVIDMLVLLFMYKNKVHYEKYRTCEEFLDSRFEG